MRIRYFTILLRLVFLMVSGFSRGWGGGISNEFHITVTSQLHRLKITNNKLVRNNNPVTQNPLGTTKEDGNFLNQSSELNPSSGSIGFKIVEGQTLEKKKNPLSNIVVYFSAERPQTNYINPQKYQSNCDCGVVVGEGNDTSPAVIELRHHGGGQRHLCVVSGLVQGHADGD